MVNDINFNYVLGFSVVIIIMYIFLRVSMVKSEPEGRFLTNIIYSQKPAGNIKLITKGGKVVYVDVSLLDHYLTQLLDNMKLVADKVDRSKCNSIKGELVKLKKNMEKQISELVNVKMGKQAHLLGRATLEKINTNIDQARTVKDVLFLNDMGSVGSDINENIPVDYLIHEIIKNMEIFLKILHVTPEHIDIMDASHLEEIIDFIYEEACYDVSELGVSEISKPETFLDSDMRYSNTDESRGRTVRGTLVDPLVIDRNTNEKFGTMADFDKHQNLGENDRIYTRGRRGFNPGKKAKKRMTKNKKRAITNTHSSVAKEKFSASNNRKVHKKTAKHRGINIRMLQDGGSLLNEQKHTWGQERCSLSRDGIEEEALYLAARLQSSHKS